MRHVSMGVGWALLAAGAALAGGCSADPEQDGTTEQVESALLTNAQVLGFESLAGWTTSAGRIALSTTRSQGSYSLSISGIGYATLTSARIATVSPLGTLAFDLMLPLQQPNPYWYGQVQLFVDVPSQGIHNLMIGQKELTGLPLNQFNRVDLHLTAELEAKLRGSYSDLAIKVGLNVPAGTGTYRLDNLRFLPGPVRRLDAFLMTDVSACAIGDPCPGPDESTCIHFYEHGTDNPITRMTFSPDNFRVVKPSDPARYSAAQVHCMHTVLTPADVARVRGELAVFRDHIYQYSGGDLNLNVVYHEVGPTELEMTQWDNTIWVDESKMRDAAWPYLSRDTEFTIMLNSIIDVDTGWFHDLPGCGITPFGRLAGSEYQWVPVVNDAFFWGDCSVYGTFEHEFMHQVGNDLVELSGFQDIYANGLPPCGQCASDPALWFVDPDNFCADPDWPRCGQSDCATGEEAHGHMLGAHWPRGRKFVTNSCRDGLQDYDETGVDVGPNCRP